MGILSLSFFFFLWEFMAEAAWKLSLMGILIPIKGNLFTKEHSGQLVSKRGSKYKWSLLQSCYNSNLNLN